MAGAGVWTLHSRKILTRFSGSPPPKYPAATLSALPTPPHTSNGQINPTLYKQSCQRSPRLSKAVLPVDDDHGTSGKPPKGPVTSGFSAGSAPSLASGANLLSCSIT